MKVGQKRAHCTHLVMIKESKTKETSHACKRLAASVQRRKKKKVGLSDSPRTGAR